jgi:hypothetical protein
LRFIIARGFVKLASATVDTDIPIFPATCLGSLFGQQAKPAVAPIGAVSPAVTHGPMVFAGASAALALMTGQGACALIPHGDSVSDGTWLRSGNL